MKILLCHNFYQQQGGEDQVFRDERWLLESHGHHVLTYTRHNDAIHQMRPAVVALQALWSRQAYREIRELIRRERPEVMHCTNTFPLISPAAYYAAHAEGTPVVQSLHNFRLYCVNGYMLRDDRPCEACLGKLMAWRGVLHRCYRGSRSASAAVAAMQGAHRLWGTWSRRIDHFITVSEFARSKLVSAGIAEDRITFKPNFVHPDQGMGPGAGQYVVFVGRLSPEKGVAELLSAWSRLNTQIPLKIVGDGPLMPAAQEAARQDARIEALGRRPFEEVLQIVGDASFLVMPSIWHETFGRTIVEAFSRGVPALVSRLGAMQELVEEGRTGLTFSPSNPDELCEKIELLWKDDALRGRMRLAARREYEQKYTAEANHQQLMAIYERVVANSLRRRGSRPTEPAKASSK